MSSVAATDVIETLRPTSRFTSVDLPTFGRPTIATNPDRNDDAGSDSGEGSVTGSVPRRRGGIRSPSPGPSVGATAAGRVGGRMTTETIRRPSTRSVRNSSPWKRTVSPSSGTWPSRLKTSPPTVSHSVSGSSTPSSSLTSSIGIPPGTRSEPSGRRSTPGASTSYSSVISPTISSSRSSSVTSPDVPPYSSITIAMWNCLRLHLAQELGDALLLGHEHRRPQRRAHGLVRPHRRGRGRRGP